MTEYLTALIMAIWFGILTSISPCPMATNIAAVSYIGQRMNSRRQIFISGLLYVGGRMLAYILLGVILVSGILSIPDISFFLQYYMNIFLGPFLIIVGLILIGLIKFSLPGINVNGKFSKRVDKLGLYGAALLGFIFALSFCPVSAVLFFGSLLPLSVNQDSRFLMPALFGIGTGLPVLILAYILSAGTSYLGVILKKLATFEKYSRRITGVIFILAGIYLTTVYIFKIDL